MPALARLRHLSAAEVPFRLRERWVLATDRFWRPPDPPDGPAPRWPWPERPLVGAPHARVPAPPDPWPKTPSADLSPLVGPHDPRDTWEWTRLQHLALRADDPRARTDALAWLARNPPGRGIGWATAMEVALRLVSLVRIATRQPDPAFREAVHTHAAWIVRHPSRGTSANNHRVAELGALALASRVLDRPFSGPGELPLVLDAQVHPDGVGVEQSPSYLAFDLEWALLARRAGVAGLDPTIDRAARFLWTLCAPGGGPPPLGDDDGGRVIATTGAPEPHYVRSVTGAARATLGASVPEGWTPDGRARALGVGPAPAAAPPSTCFALGGLTVLRRGALHVVFDHGPLGGCTLAAHGHADALSVQFHVDGQPVVVGRGTGRYNADPDGRRFHRGTGAHPTVVIDGRDQSRPHDHPFLWRTRARTVLEDVDLVAGRVTARCDGTADRGVVHRRTVEVADGRLTVTDRLEGRGRHHVAVGFPLAPGLEVGDDRSVRLGAVRLARWVGDPALALRVVCGGERPGPGWHSPSYGRWEPATTLSFQAHVGLPIVLRTVWLIG